jgi:hypothetical protein
VAYCRDHFQTDPSELAIIDKFATRYQSSKVIWWYTHQRFLFPMLNQSVRCMEADIMVDMNFFIRDLHQRLDRLDRKRLPSYRGRPFSVY